MSQEPNIFNSLMKKIFGKTEAIPVAEIPKSPSKEDLEQLARSGLTLEGIKQLIDKQINISWDRYSLYQTIQNSLTHPLMAAALEEYATTATAFDNKNNTTVYITSKSKEYKTKLDALFERIDIEEHIYDWTYNICAGGDLFLEINGKPGVGILSLKDDKPPVEYYRIENNGQLIGFVHKSFAGSGDSVIQATLLPPYSIVHFRINGARKRRSTIGNPSYGYSSSVIGVGGNSLQESTNYGSSILMAALPTYKRLRLAEDCIMMARALNTPLRHIWMIGTNSQNIEGTATMISQYGTALKRSKVLNTQTGSENFQDSLQTLSSVEDLIIPVWGEVNQIKVEKMGGETDIKWIVDVERLESLLAASLSIPLPLLKGAREGEAGLNPGNSLEKMDIRFSRKVSKVQRALRAGIKRICQIHLAYLGMDPDPKLFDVHLGDTSSAAEEEQKDILIKSSEAADKIIDTLAKITGEDMLDREKAFNIINDKVLHLKDVQYTDLIKTVPVASAPQPISTQPTSEVESETTIQDSKIIEDLYSFTPRDENKWKELYENVKVEIKKA